MATDIKDIAERVDVLRDRFAAWGLLVATVALAAAVWTTAPTLELKLPLPAGTEVTLNLGYVLAIGMPLLAIAYAWTIAPLLAVRRYQDAVAREVGQGNADLSSIERLRMMGPFGEPTGESPWQRAAWSPSFGARVLMLIVVPVLAQIWIGEQYFLGLHYFKKQSVVAHWVKKLAAAEQPGAERDPNPNDPTTWNIDPRDSPRWHEYFFRNEPALRMQGDDTVTAEYYFVENWELESSCLRRWLKEHFEVPSSSTPPDAVKELLKQSEKSRCVFVSFPKFTLWVNSWINLISLLVVTCLAIVGLPIFSGAYFRRRLAEEYAVAAKNKLARVESRAAE